MSGPSGRREAEPHVERNHVCHTAEPSLLQLAAHVHNAFEAPGTYDGGALGVGTTGRTPAAWVCAACHALRWAGIRSGARSRRDRDAGRAAHGRAGSLRARARRALSRILLC